MKKTLSISIAVVAFVAIGAVLPGFGCTVYMDFHSPPDAGGAGGGGGGGCEPGTVAPCYAGPEGTENVGLCKAGEQTCNPDGIGFGPCDGAVLPRTEDCATPTDEDCDGLAPSCSGTPIWSKRFGDDKEQYAVRVVANSAGDVLVAGDFVGSVDFGGGPMVSGTAGDSFIVKLDGAVGEHRWSKQFGDTANLYDPLIAVDGLDNVLVVGTLWGSLDFGDGPIQSAGDGDVLVAKFDSAGNYLWAKSFGDVGSQRGNGIAVDNAGNIVVTGAFSGSVDFGGGPLTSAGDSDVFIVKFDTDGEWVWNRRFGDTNSQEGENVAMDQTGNVLVAGSFAGTVDFGGGPLTAPLVDVFTIKLDAFGDHIWSRRVGASYIAVSVDKVGDALFTGYFSGTLDFGGESLVSAGGGDLFVGKMDSSQNPVFSRSFGDDSDQVGLSIAADTSGNLLLTGFFRGAINFGDGPIASAGALDILLAKLDASGNPLWSKRFGDAATDQAGMSVAFDKFGNALLAGTFYGTVDFGNGPLVSAGGNDIFVAKFTP